MTRNTKVYSISIINSILDSVHGLIGLTEVENQIERLPVFKRLQEISQLGLVKRIFPCALHNRYIHSIGVMFVSDKMAIQLKLNEDERQVIRLAGLLHDIGHYPLSHDIEMVYSEYNSAQHAERIIQKPKALEKLDKLLEYNLQIPIELDGHETKRYHHETIGSLIIENNLKIRKIVASEYVKGNKRFDDGNTTDIELENIAASILNDIGNIVVGNIRHKSKHFSENYTLMVQLIHSEIDADNIDYLLRDAMFSGTTYGVMDMDLLIGSLAKINIEFPLPDNFDKPMTYPSEKHNIVGVKPKGIGYIDQFMVNRYLAYNQVIYHKYASIYSAMLRYTVLWLLDSGFLKEYQDPRELALRIDNDDLFLSFNDNLILNKINGVNISKCPELVKSCILGLRKYDAFELAKSNADETYTAIDANDAYFTIVRSEVYKHLKELSDNIAEVNKQHAKEKTKKWHNDYQNLITDSFLINIEARMITKQLSTEAYEDLLHANAQIDKEKRGQYDFDRLMNGVPVIDEKNPVLPLKLIVDYPDSILHRIYKQQCIRIRQYVNKV